MSWLAETANEIREYLFLSRDDVRFGEDEWVYKVEEGRFQGRLRHWLFSRVEELCDIDEGFVVNVDGKEEAAEDFVLIIILCPDFWLVECGEDLVQICHLRWVVKWLNTRWIGVHGGDFIWGGDADAGRRYVDNAVIVGVVADVEDESSARVDAEGDGWLRLDVSDDINRPPEVQSDVEDPVCEGEDG